MTKSEREREKREKAKRDERRRRRRKDFRYDIASRYLNRLAATRTHCVKLISIFGDGRERVKNLERVYVIPRQNQGARARGRGLNEQGVREGGGSEHIVGKNETSKSRDIIDIIARA